MNDREPELDKFLSDVKAIVKCDLKSAQALSRVPASYHDDYLQAARFGAAWEQLLQWSRQEQDYIPAYFVLAARADLFQASSRLIEKCLSR
jgi:hypothetical protein